MKTIFKMNEKGPYILEGDFQILDINGNDITPEGKIAKICRCGKSENKPFCNGCGKETEKEENSKQSCCGGKGNCNH